MGNGLAWFRDNHPKGVQDGEPDATKLAELSQQIPEQDRELRIIEQVIALMQQGVQLDFSCDRVIRQQMQKAKKRQRAMKAQT